MHPLCQCNPFGIHMAKVLLNVDEQASRTREGECYGPELLKDLVPVSEADTLLVGGGWRL